MLTQVWQDFVEAWGPISEVLSTPLGASLSVAGLLMAVVSIALVFIVASRLSRLSMTVFGRFANVDPGLPATVATLVRYLTIVLGLTVVISSLGVDLGAFAFIAGAAGVGIGFGLQNIFSNFLSGVIILFERPIKVGDRVDVGSVHGDVVRIGLRSTTIVTNDNISIIVPNSEFISCRVINWSYNDRNVRFDIKVGVAYGTDPELVRRILLDVAKNNSHVLSTPEPNVLFEEFADSSLNFTLWVWTSSHSTRPRVLTSELNFAISKAFALQGVEIPFPQRDVHIKSGTI